MLFFFFIDEPTTEIYTYCPTLSRHDALPILLKIIGTELQKRLRKIDFIARFGGEEFVVLLPNTPYEAGLQLMESLRESIGSCPFHFKGERVAITLSAGLTAFSEGDSTERAFRSEEHTSELQSLMRISYAVFCLQKKKQCIT